MRMQLAGVGFGGGVSDKRLAHPDEVYHPIVLSVKSQLPAAAGFTFYGDIMRPTFDGVKQLNTQN